MPIDRGRDAGFALVDVLVGVAVAAMAMTLLMSTFAISRSASTRAAGTFNSLTLMADVGNLFVKSVDRMIVSPTSAGGSGFAGSVRAIKFVALPPTGSRADEPVEMEFLSTASRSGTQIIVSNRAGEREETAGVDGLEVDFSFFGRPPSAASVVMRQEWDEKWPAPSEVVMSLRSIKDGMSQDFVARPRASRPLACAAIDAASACGASP
ncbi:hypothetical protein SAMN05444161_4590 [Rhizobiales bacterium GAS191]|nr:hypothetical protein SAMN05444161_4590 [Rhizobiales bacterium GAS191]